MRGGLRQLWVCFRFEKTRFGSHQRSCTKNNVLKHLCAGACFSRGQPHGQGRQGPRCFKGFVYLCVSGMVRGEWGGSEII